MRVPSSQLDYFPDITRKENILIDKGDEWMIEISSLVEISESIKFGVGYEVLYKSKDSITGARYSSSEYGLMTQNTKQNAHTVKLETSFSTINKYLKKEFFAPLSFTYSYTNLLSGINVIRRVGNDLTLSLFF